MSFPSRAPPGLGSPPIRRHMKCYGLDTEFPFEVRGINLVSRKWNDIKIREHERKFMRNSFAIIVLTFACSVGFAQASMAYVDEAKASGGMVQLPDGSWIYSESIDVESKAYSQAEDIHSVEFCIFPWGAWDGQEDQAFCDKGTVARRVLNPSAPSCLKDFNQSVRNVRGEIADYLANRLKDINERNQFKLKFYFTPGYMHRGIVYQGAPNMDLQRLSVDLVIEKKRRFRSPESYAIGEVDFGNGAKRESCALSSPEVESVKRMLDQSVSNYRDLRK